MKLTHLKVVSCFLIGLLLTSFSCSENEDMIYDFAPIELKVYVSTVDGSNLLDNKIEGNLLNNSIKIIHNGTAYDLDIESTEKEKPATKAYLPIFHGLKLQTDINGNPYLYIGEFDGAADYENEIVTVDWGDGTYNTITFDSRVSWRKSEPVIHRFFYLDKELVENEMTIYKK